MTTKRYQLVVNGGDVDNLPKQLRNSAFADVRSYSSKAIAITKASQLYKSNGLHTEVIDKTSGLVIFERGN